MTGNGKRKVDPHEKATIRVRMKHRVHTTYAYGPFRGILIIHGKGYDGQVEEFFSKRFLSIAVWC